MMTEVLFERPVEAMAAITWIICTADDEGSLEERAFLNDEIRNTQEFKGMNRTEFTSLLASCRTKLFSKLDNNGFCLSQSSVECVIASAKETLNKEQQIEAFQMAQLLAESDGLVETEIKILKMLGSEFGIDQQQIGALSSD